jgi:type IV pilus assembly protein PilA
MKQIQKGFTLIELMIVVAIIGILAAVAIPAYSNYTKKAKFTEVTQATQAIKTGIEACYSDVGDMTLCYAGTNGVPSPVLGTVAAQPTTAGASPRTAGAATTPNFGKYVDYVVVYPTDATHIEITAAAINAASLNGDVYDLQGTASNAGVQWTLDPASTCLSDSICK